MAGVRGRRQIRIAALDRNVVVALDQVKIALESGRLPEAREAIRQAEGLVAGGGAPRDDGDAAVSY